MNLSNKHLRPAQMWRMSRTASSHLRSSARREHLLVLKRSRLIVLTNEIGGWNVAPGGTSEFGLLHQIRLCDEPRSPHRGLGGWEIVVERFFTVEDVEAAVGLDNGVNILRFGRGGGDGEWVRYLLSRRCWVIRQRR